MQINKKKKILLVDDNRNILKTLIRILSKEGYELETADDGKSAIKKVTEWMPDIILLDLMMPEISGEEVCSWIKNDHKYNYIYIIMLSAKSDITEQTAGLNVGADDYMAKPFHPELLTARIRLGIRHLEEKKEAAFDTLTGLYNRRIFDLVLAQELSKNKRYGISFSLLFLDIDRFKSVNDTFGHKAGDMVLKEIAEILKATVRDSDMTARWGGEEIALLLPETDMTGAELLAEKLRTAIESHTFGQVGKITASFGVATAEDSGSDIVSDADKALYEAKQTGRNKTICFRKKLYKEPEFS